jgi:hypothetical protein
MEREKKGLARRYASRYGVGLYETLAKCMGLYSTTMTMRVRTDAMMRIRLYQVTDSTGFKEMCGQRMRISTLP